MVWFTLIALILMAFFKTIWAIYFIIIFDVYWLVRIIYMVIHLIVSWRRYKKDVKIDWLEKLREEKKDEWNKIYHLIVLPTYTEPFDVLRDTFSVLMKMQYPLDKFIIVLGGEERDKENLMIAVWWRVLFGSSMLFFTKGQKLFCIY